ncbi:very short patch repair endonuclease [Arthrobacter sp.]|uniref:very short patch repair endonuclease n=1 Tax=Arthrobacter sp. TaxID=1667 RepID=UPI003A91507E
MDRLTLTERSAQMSRIRGTDTQPELLVRRLAHRAGYRYRLHGQISAAALQAARRRDPTVAFRGGKLPGRPDLVFASRRKVVFVNGCFWHEHDCPVGRHAPATNAGFWADKRRRNAERDERNHADLRAIGWQVLDLWECQLKDPAVVLEDLERFLADVPQPRLEDQPS